jgi:hypothetical protein
VKAQKKREKMREKMEGREKRLRKERKGEVREEKMDYGNGKKKVNLVLHFCAHPFDSVISYIFSCQMRRLSSEMRPLAHHAGLGFVTGGHSQINVPN